MKKFKVSVTRTIINNEIHELFYIEPYVSFCNNPQYAIYFAYWLARGNLSVKNQKIQDIIELNNGKYKNVYIIDKANEQPRLFDSVEFYYTKSMSKKCHNCLFCKKGYCTTKSKKIEKYSYYKCLYWQENPSLCISVKMIKKS